MALKLRSAACLAGLLGALAPPALSQPTEPAAAPPESNLASLPTPPDTAASGETTEAVRRPLDQTGILVDGEIIRLEDREIRLENGSWRTLYHRGPVHVPK